MKHSRSLALCLVVLGVPALAGAHEGHKHRVMGTIERVEKDRLDVKDTEGKTVQLVVTDETVVQRGEKPVAGTELKVGERVVAEFEQTGSTQTAQSIRVAAPAARAQTPYSCPMHPEVQADKPGRCPKCGMNLELKAKSLPGQPQHQH